MTARLRPEAVATASSRICSAARASPPARAERQLDGTVGNAWMQGSTLRSRITRSSSFESDGQLDHRQRESSAELTEARVFGGRAYEGDEPILDGVQDRVLLCLVEAVDLVDEEDRPKPFPPEAISRSGDHGADVVDAGRHRRDLFELGTGPLRDDSRDRGLSGARWPEEDHRGRAVVLDGAANADPVPSTCC